MAYFFKFVSVIEMENYYGSAFSSEHFELLGQQRGRCAYSVNVRQLLGNPKTCILMGQCVSFNKYPKCILFTNAIICAAQ